MRDFAASSERGTHVGRRRVADRPNAVVTARRRANHLTVVVHGLIRAAVFTAATTITRVARTGHARAMTSPFREVMWAGATSPAKVHEMSLGVAAINDAEQSANGDKDSMKEGRGDTLLETLRIRARALSELTSHD